MFLRLISFLVLILSAFFLPLPVVLFLFMLAVMIFPYFWEGVLLGVVCDSLYFSPLGIGFFTVSFVFSILILEKFKFLIQSKNIVPRVVVGVFGGLLFCVIIFLSFN